MVHRRAPGASDGRTCPLGPTRADMSDADVPCANDDGEHWSLQYDSWYSRTRGYSRTRAAAHIQSSGPVIPHPADRRLRQDYGILLDVLYALCNTPPEDASDQRERDVALVPRDVA